MNVLKKQALLSLKNARGNLNAAINMLEDDRYCVDISHQILAVIALLRKGNEQVLHQHIEHCVKEAFESDNEQDKQQKLNEIMELVSKVGR